MGTGFGSTATVITARVMPLGAVAEGLGRGVPAAAEGDGGAAGEPEGAAFLVEHHDAVPLHAKRAVVPDDDLHLGHSRFYLRWLTMMSRGLGRGQGPFLGSSAGGVGCEARPSGCWQWAPSFRRSQGRPPRPKGA